MAHSTRRACWVPSRAYQLRVAFLPKHTHEERNKMKKRDHLQYRQAAAVSKPKGENQINFAGNVGKRREKQKSNAQATGV